MNKFNPLVALRVINTDKELSTAQRGWMLAVVLGTDNKTGRVRRSLEALADEANCSYKSAGRYMADKEVAKYFVRTKVNARTVNYDWSPVGLFDAQESQSETTPVGQSVSDVGQSVQPVGQIDAPSTLSSTLSSTKNKETEVKEQRDTHSPTPLTPLEERLAEVKSRKNNLESDIRLAVLKRHREVSNKENPALIERAVAVALAKTEKYPASILGRMAYAEVTR